MKRSKRVLILAVFVEALLICGGLFLAFKLKAQGANGAETIARIGEVMGAASIGFAVLFTALYFSLRKKGD